MRVWIDLSNSPHPLLFAPIARRLEAQGDHVLVTARDNAQTAELARARWPDVDVIGGESPAGRVAKARTLTSRVLELGAWARATRPDVALSHNSYAQIVAARGIGVRVVTAMDFEHQPANHLAFRLAHEILLPEHIPLELVGRQGANVAKVRRYPGIKEQLYIGDFEPDSEVLGRLGVVREPGTIVVVARTPPSRATYHAFGNPTFLEALRIVAARGDVRTIVLARHPEQTAAINELRLANSLIPARAIDSRSLMYAADLMLGAGGTMTREAALLGIPTYNLYAGEAPRVDRWLEQQGLMRRLRDPRELAHVSARPTQPRSTSELRSGADAIADAFLATIAEAV